MTATAFRPTDEQAALIRCDGSAFVSACPGAGKTRCIVERARRVLSKPETGLGIAFLSFTNAAVSELGRRLIAAGLLPTPLLPHFVGTFDSFIWNFMVQPYGLNDVDVPLRLVPDTAKQTIKPYAAARELPLECFDRDTGNIIAAEARTHGIDTTRFNATAHETVARQMRQRQLSAGQLDFEDARNVAAAHLEDTDFSQRLAAVLRARFGEIIVDEAQDCNPKDLAIVNWLQTDAAIGTKVVCDPHQSIYSFRGGVTHELLSFRDTFSGSRLPITGNFRSTGHICKAVSTLRAPTERGSADEAIGDNKDLDIPVYVLRYSGASVSPRIGEVFIRILNGHSIDSKRCRLVSATRDSATKAVGGSTKKLGNHLSLQIASAVMAFHRADTTMDILGAVEGAHRVALTLEGALDNKTYHQVLAERELEPADWRPEMIDLIKRLKLDVESGETREQWIERARSALRSKLPEGDSAIGRRIQNRVELGEIFSFNQTAGITTRTIHAVKGEEYPGICVVMTRNTVKGVLTYLEDDTDETFAEDARKLYVGASRAQRLLAIACPRSQCDKFAAHLSMLGARVEIVDVSAEEPA